MTLSTEQPKAVRRVEPTRGNVDLLRLDQELGCPTLSRLAGHVVEKRRPDALTTNRRCNANVPEQRGIDMSIQWLEAYPAIGNEHSAADAPPIEEGGDELPFVDVEAGPPIDRSRAGLAVIVLLVWNLKWDRGNGVAAKRRVHGGIIENLGDREAD